MLNLLACLAALPWSPLASAYEGSAFADVERVVFANPYAQLPRYQVTEAELDEETGGGETANRLLAAARRTLSVRHDLIQFEGGRKLFQANGRCFSGTWNITERSAFSGYFAAGSKGLVIVRASVSLSETTRGHKRAFALAGKIFPTLDPAQVVKTVNFFAMENLLGTYDDYFLDAVMDNEPEVSGLPGGLSQFFLGLRISGDLETADREVSGDAANVRYRPVRPIAAIDAPSVAAPRWMRLTVAPETVRVDADDFRDELALANYPGKRLVFDVAAAANHAGGKASAEWRRLGYIELTRDVVSHGCDARLHFAHPPAQ